MEKGALELRWAATTKPRQIECSGFALLGHNAQTLNFACLGPALSLTHSLKVNQGSMTGSDDVERTMMLSIGGVWNLN